MPGPSLQDAQQIYSNAGLRTQYGVILPPGARVAAFVRSTGLQSGDDAFLATNLVPTLAQGLARVRPGLGDFVVCLPGHVESVVDATTFSSALVSGTKIIGVGKGSNQPLFNFTTAGARWVVGVTDVLIAGLHITTSGAVTNATGISVTANDFAFLFNDVELNTTLGSFSIFIGISGTASRFDVSGNVVRGPSVGTTGTAVQLSSSGSDGRVADNEMICSCSSANGIINVTGAGTGLKILRNVLSNISAACVSAITLANVAITGQCAYNSIGVLSTGASVSGTTGITIGAAVVMSFFQNFITNDPLTSGKLLPTLDT